MLKEVEERMIKEMIDLRQRTMRRAKIGLISSIIFSEVLLGIGVLDGMHHLWFALALQVMCFCFNIYTFRIYWNILK